MIKTWRQRCEEHPDHNGIVSEGMIQARMQEEIDELRDAIKSPTGTWWHEPVSQMGYRQWQGLTDDEREQFRQWAHPDIIEAIELKLQQRNA